MVVVAECTHTVELQRIAQSLLAAGCAKQSPILARILDCPHLWCDLLYRRRTEPREDSHQHPLSGESTGKGALAKT